MVRIMELNKDFIRKSDSERKKTFEELKTPEELLDFLEKKVQYGFVGRGGKVYLGAEGSMDEEYSLQSPEDVLKSGVGVCWDVAELERSWFEKNGYTHKVVFLVFEKITEEGFPTHTFLAYNRDDIWVWFEHSFEMYRGLHEYKNFQDLVTDVAEKQLEYAKRYCGATDEDKKYLKAFEFQGPAYGCSAKEFFENAEKGQLLIDV